LPDAEPQKTAESGTVSGAANVVQKRSKKIVLKEN
jgi:hypothetical protein